jgi:hypothetical protein
VTFGKDRITGVLTLLGHLFDMQRNIAYYAVANAHIAVICRRSRLMLTAFANELICHLKQHIESLAAQNNNGCRPLRVAAPRMLRQASECRLEMCAG